jgi:hypothetical protein
MKNQHNKHALGIAAVAVAVIVLAAVVGLAFVLTSPQTSSSLSTGTSTNTVTTTSGTNGAGASGISTSTATASSGSNSTVSYSLAYLTTYGGCAVGGSVAPCWGGNASTFVQFNCLTTARSPQGCIRQVNVTSPTGSYSITVWNPMTNSTAPTWANCYWTVQSESTEHGWGYCSQENSTSFIMGIQGPGRQ